jgi:hypothetical protein
MVRALAAGSAALWLAGFSFALAAQSARPGPQYVGSASCNGCHASIYARWSKTRMANVVRDPKVHPDAIIPDLTKADPLVTFTKNDIAFAYDVSHGQVDRLGCGGAQDLAGIFAVAGRPVSWAREGAAVLISTPSWRAERDGAAKR